MYCSHRKSQYHRESTRHGFGVSALLSLFPSIFCFGSPAGIGAEEATHCDCGCCGLRGVAVAAVVVVSVFGRLVFRSFRFAVRLETRSRNSFSNWILS